MNGSALFPFLLVATALAGCGDDVCFDGPAEAFDIKYINETDESYYIYLDWGTGMFDEEWFLPTESDASAGATAPGCGRLGPTWWLHVQIREPKPNHEDVSAPEIRGGALVFEGNWTGLTCNNSYIFRYNGPSDVHAYELEDCSRTEWRRDLQRVPP